MKAGAKERLRARIVHWAGQLRVQPQRVRIQTMRRKWGSCSPAGCVTISADLVKRPAAFQDFVVVHELLHLRIRNHGKLFHATLRAHLRGNRWAAACQRDAVDFVKKGAEIYHKAQRMQGKLGRMPTSVR